MKDVVNFQSSEKLQSYSTIDVNNHLPHLMIKVLNPSYRISALGTHQDHQNSQIF